MQRRLPPLNALRAFEAAARLGSFKQAAAELHVSHGAVSRHVQVLERWLGATMFRRLNRRVVLTDAGSAYLAEVSAAFDRIALATSHHMARGRYLLKWKLRSCLCRLYSIQPHVRLWVKSGRGGLKSRCPLYPRKRTFAHAIRMSVLGQKQTSGNDGLLRFSSRFFDQCCHLGCVRKKDRVAARKFNDLRLRPLRHESLEVRIDHSVLHGNYCVARLLFPSRNCGLRLQCIT